ncbi:hypothetical protein M3650_25225 [Paenibacillus sp. MER TA 81-3]|uniref:hypothetical protein n=1 Tax=Paenibacillus sp. MER TA 81-3 TaxID=2939573 RepID=UPI00203D7E25|nr:hypothetical protein [Paenibacillus sp. MER TA 81-3]MCM3341838.1 hypothetical protein [Paenibacillus sp. MER TA 81-3]
MKSMSKAAIAASGFILLFGSLNIAAEAASQPTKAKSAVTAVSKASSVQNNKKLVEAETAKLSKANKKSR